MRAGLRDRCRRVWSADWGFFGEGDCRRTGVLARRLMPWLRVAEGGGGWGEMGGVDCGGGLSHLLESTDEASLV